jgi:Asp-tRNA(Asn)/Glu-tRNA(Gln) amidotransferase A subunit family amidase
MQNTEGMPYGVQIVAQPYKDEIALRVMKEVEGIFNFHKYAL